MLNPMGHVIVIELIRSCKIVLLASPLLDDAISSESI